MAPGSKQLSQKEYLKKYLSKKKKKKPRNDRHRDNVKLIDDDAVNRVDDQHFDLEDGDDAPVIAGYYDERPTEIKLMENYRNANRWQPVPGSKKEHDGGRSSSSLKHQRSRNVRDEDHHSPAANRRERHEEDSRSGKRKHQSEHAASPPRSRHRQESPLARTPPRGERRIEEHHDHSPFRRGDRGKFDDRGFRDNDHSPRRTNRYNGGGNDGDRGRHEEMIMEEKYARNRHQQQHQRIVDNRSPSQQRKWQSDVDEHRRGGANSRLPPFAERNRMERPTSSPARRKDRLDERRHADDGRRELQQQQQHVASAEHHRMQSIKNQKRRPILDDESPRNRPGRGDDRMPPKAVVGHRHNWSPARGDRRQSPPRNDRRPSPGLRASLDDRVFSPAPSRRYHSPTLQPDSRRLERQHRDNSSLPRGARPRNDRFIREVASPIPLRKGGGRRIDEDMSPLSLRRKDRLREDRDVREPRDLRDVRPARDTRDPRELKDLRDVFVDSRDVREFRGDGRDGRDGRESRDPRGCRDPRDARDFSRDRRDLRDTLRETRDLRDTLNARGLRDVSRDGRDFRDPREAARGGQEVVRSIEWKERKDVVPRRIVEHSSPPLPPPQPRDSPRRRLDSSSSTLKRKEKFAAPKKVADERHRGGGGGGGGGSSSSGRRQSPASPPPKQQGVSRPESRYESAAPPSPKPPHRPSSRLESHSSNHHPKYRDESEQRFQHASKDQSLERNHRGRHTPTDQKEMAVNSSKDHDGREKRRGENSSSKVVKERDRKPREQEKGGDNKSSRNKDENFGLLSSKKATSKVEEKLSEEQSGKNAATIYRDRKTGKKRDLHAEKLEKIEKRRLEEEKKEQYYHWGRGLKQVEEEKERVNEELHEMSKPLARYADDEDLDKSLKQKEISGLDPMLGYINRKKRKKDTKDGQDSKPTYKGAWLPNRFNIPPGHKWDGVDRSNGYEKRYFEKQSDKKSMEEEAYKWCSEDM